MHQKHQDKFLTCENLPGNKPDSDSHRMFYFENPRNYLLDSLDSHWEKGKQRGDQAVEMESKRTGRVSENVEETWRGGVTK